MRQALTIRLAVAFAVLGSLLWLGQSASAGSPGVKSPPKSKVPRPETPPHRFDSASQKTVAAWINALQRELEGYLKGPSQKAGEAEKALVARALRPTKFAPLLAAFKKRAANFKADRVKLNGIEVRLTLWHHRIPMRDVELYFWRVGTSNFELLRLLGDDSIHTYFAGPEIVRYATETGKALGALGMEVIDLITAKRCAALPTVKPKHLEPFLPKHQKAYKQTLWQFHKFRFRQGPQCRMLHDVPFTHVTFRVGDVGGVLLDRAGERYAFKLGLTVGKDKNRMLRLRMIIPPVSPEQYQPRGVKLKVGKKRAPAPLGPRRLQKPQTP